MTNLSHEPEINKEDVGCFFSTPIGTGGLCPISAKIRGIAALFHSFGPVPIIWSEPTMLAWNQAGHRSEDCITDASLQNEVDTTCRNSLILALMGHAHLFGYNEKKMGRPPYENTEKGMIRIF